MGATATHAGSKAACTTLTDEQLVAASCDGDDQAISELLRRYRPLTRAKASTYFLVGGDRDDVVQEGMIGLYKAIRDFDPDHGALFRSFAELCVTRQVLTAVKGATRQKHTPLNTYVSFDRPQGGDDHPAGSARTLGETIPDIPANDPLHALVSADEVAQLQAVFDAVLSELEADVLRLYVEGRSYEDIAEQLGRHAKSIDNAIQRIKRKLEASIAEQTVAATA